MNFIKHFFKQHLCVENIYIDKNVERPLPILKCKECGREIGFLYFNITGFKPFLEPKFKKYRQEIERWVNEHTKERNTMGGTSEREWEDMLHNIKQYDEDGVQSMGGKEWNGKCKENSEGREPIGFGETYDNVEVEMSLFEEQNV